MYEKKNKEINHKVDNIMEERNLLRELKKKLMNDTVNKNDFSLQQKLEFLDSNQALMDDKAMGI